MQKTYSIILILLTCSFLLIACTKNDNNSVEDEKKPEQEENNGANTIPENTEDEPEESESLNVEEISNEIIEAIIDKDMKTIAKYVHPEKGLLFSPYIYVEEDAVVIDKKDIQTLLKSNHVFNWGLYDGKGTPIQLTATDYFDAFLDMTPYLEPDEILIDLLQERGNTLNNIDEKFPNSKVIEYYYDGSEEFSGIDWSSVLFIYDEVENGMYNLRAIIRDMWTI